MPVEPNIVAPPEEAALLGLLVNRAPGTAAARNLDVGIGPHALDFPIDAVFPAAGSVHRLAELAFLDGGEQRLRPGRTPNEGQRA